MMPPMTPKTIPTIAPVLRDTLTELKTRTKTLENNRHFRKQKSAIMVARTKTFEMKNKHERTININIHFEIR